VPLSLSLPIVKGISREIIYNWLRMPYKDDWLYYSAPRSIWLAVRVRVSFSSAEDWRWGLDYLLLALNWTHAELLLVRWHTVHQRRSDRDMERGQAVGQTVSISLKIKLSIKSGCWNWGRRSWRYAERALWRQNWNVTLTCHSFFSLACFSAQRSNGTDWSRIFHRLSDWAIKYWIEWQQENKWAMIDNVRHLITIIHHLFIVCHQIFVLYLSDNGSNRKCCLWYESMYR
jgi:hypothetical protein